MSANNISTEKMDTKGFQTGGYTAPAAKGGGKSPRVLIKDTRESPGNAKTGGSYGKSANATQYNPKK